MTKVKKLDHLLKIMDLSGEDILAILDLADTLKYWQKQGTPYRPLAGKTLGLIFQKASTRTRVSFEVGMTQLGGTPLFLSANDLQIGRGEPVQDTARVLSRYLDGLMIRTYAQAEVEDFARYGSIPVINGLTDFAHPCQVLADLMTVRELKGKLDGLKACFIGDGHNMANSLIVGCLKVGMRFTMACPEGYDPHPDVLAYAEQFDDAFCLERDPLVAACGADVVFTDVHASMGQEGEQAERMAAFRGYQVNDALMAVTGTDSMALHCLPAHREEEITTQVLEAHADEIFQEAENRLHAQKAVLVMTMGG